MSPGRTVLPSRWSVWPCPPADGPTNMAIDAALMAHAAPDHGVWRWYRWSTPTISFGRHERTRDRFSEASVAAASLGAVRRPTGGRALLHARELTYSVTFGLAEGFGWRDAYTGVNRILHAALRHIGVPVTMAGAQPPVAPDGPLCFDMPAEGELAVDGRKLVGSAVWRQGTRYLQHGSILLHDDQGLLARAATHPLPPAPPAAALLDLGLPHTDDTLADALDTAVRRELCAHGADTPVTEFLPSASLLGEIRMQHREFIDRDRLWRR